MSSRDLPPAEAGLPPRRVETLRASFQEKMRQKGSHRPGKSGGGHRAEIRFLEMSHGLHPEVDRLNDRFLPGAPRLKAMVDVLGFESDTDGVPPALVPHLLEIFPNLERHRCCGGDIQSTLFRRWRQSGSALPSGDRGLDLCHLLEHMALELMRGMVPAAPCAGITCAHREPPHRYDLFLECDDERVGAAALRSAAHILLALLRPGQVAAGAFRFAETARYFLGRPRSLLSPGEVLAALQGDPPQLQAALRFLAAAGFLEEDRFMADLGETVLYRYRLAPAIPPLPVSLPL